MKLYLLLLVF